MSDAAPPEPPGDQDARGRSARVIWAIAVLAVVAVVVLFLVLRGGDDGGSSSQTASGPASGGATPATSTAPAVTTTQPATSTQAPPAQDTVEVVGGKPKGGVRTFTHKDGDEIRLRIVSDTADEVHVHGYDLMRDVKAGGTVEFTFKADIEGRFEVELEGAHVQLATIEVRP